MATTQTVTHLKSSDGRARARQVPACRLRVLKGPDKRRQQRFVQERLLLGTGAGADFQLTDPTVSALHAEILVDATGFRIRDLGSKNGVRVGDVRVQEAWLGPAVELSIGATRVSFESLDESEEEVLTQRDHFGELWGASPRMLELYTLLERAVGSDAPVLLRGESGAGKDLAASALVQGGPRPEGPFVVVDCPGLSLTLAESELFGHEKGAFTGSDRTHAGAFERAKGGTIYLDEVGELPMSLQPKLLGVLERRQVQRLGGSHPVAVDVRVVSSSRHDLEAAVNAGTFRADLYYRLAVLQIRMPALREHPEDIPGLIMRFLSELPGSPSFAPAVLQALYERSYPGNVRELRNAVERAAAGILEQGASAGPAGDAVRIDRPFRMEKARVTTEFERAYLGRLLEACGGNLSEAARRSGIDRMHLHSLVRKLGLTR